MRVVGSDIYDGEETFRPVGFNWQLGRIGKSGEGKLMKSVLPNVNTVRLVGILWDDQHGEQCMTDSYPYFKDSCFETLDQHIVQAQEAGLWTILTMRAATA